MSGLDKIAETIQWEAQEKVNEIKIKAEEKVQEIEQAAAQDLELTKRIQAEEAEREADAIFERFASDNRQSRKRALLKTRTEAIENVVQTAKAKIINLPDEEYFKLMRGILVKNARPGTGTVRFSQTDNKRLPASFMERCNAEIKDGKVVLGDPVDYISNGFIIIYGKVEQNCSLDSIFDINKNQIWDAVNACLTEGA